MQTLIILSIIFSILYVAQIALFVYGFIKLKPYAINKNNLILEDKIYITVIVPIKNEEKNLAVLIKNLNKQSLNKTYFEILFINDYSSDGSEQIVEKLIIDISHFNLISLKTNKKGKKEAIKQGISHAEGELIVTSDADCVHQASWLQEILYFYLEHNPKMIIAPVLMTGNSFFQKNQSLEFLSLIGSTAGAAGIKHPIMCSGANLAYRKDTFEEFKDALYSKEDSGDDVFLMHTIKQKYPKDIHYLKSNNVVVYTKAENSLKSFFKQRIRWASKSKSYFDVDTILSSILVLLINVLIVSLFIISFFKAAFLYYAISFFSLKLLFDFSLFYLTTSFFKQKDLLYHFPLLSIFYPFYIIIIAFSGLFIRKINWKT